MVHPRNGSTLIETLVLLAIATVLLACTVAMIGPERAQVARLTSSMNLRNLGMAAATYAAEWNDRQFTMTPDTLGAHGKTLGAAIAGYEEATGLALSVPLGTTADGEKRSLSMDDPANHRYLMPIGFDEDPTGSFRIPNAEPVSVYLSGRFYDPVFYAPDDEAVWKLVEPLSKKEAGFVDNGRPLPYWSSYARSAAAMYSPAVLKSKNFQDPFAFAHAFRSPSFSQALYPNLKTHTLEHHWLDNRPAWAQPSNPAIDDGPYDGCAPYQFNHYAFSRPLGLFFDGHVEAMLVADILEQHERLREQSGSGLWYDKPGGAVNGYREDMAVDPTQASFHVFTADGIRGRDVLGGR